MTRLSVWVRLHVLWRSFFFQAAANYERMQNVGFAYAMAPALAKLHQGEALRAAMERHLVFFNSNPYLSAAVLGACLNLEEQIAAGDVPASAVESLKRYTMGPLAAVGDSFFWSSLRPFAAAWAVAGVAAGINWAPIAFLLLYNLFHLGVRGYGIFAGYRDGPLVITQLQQFRLVQYSSHLRYGVGLMTGAVGALFADYARQLPGGLQNGLGPALLIMLTLIFLLCIKRKLSTIMLLYGAAGVSLAYVLLLNQWYPLF